MRETRGAAQHAATVENLADLRPKFNNSGLVKSILTARLPLGGSRQAALLALASFCYSNSRCWPSIGTVATAVGVSKRQAARILADLVEIGCIKPIGHRPGGVVIYDLSPMTFLSSGPGQKCHTPNDTGVLPPMTLASSEESIEYIIEKNGARDDDAERAGQWWRSLTPEEWTQFMLPIGIQHGPFTKTAKLVAWQRAGCPAPRK